jgi:hypothetical protein
MSGGTHPFSHMPSWRAKDICSHTMYAECSNALLKMVGRDENRKKEIKMKSQKERESRKESKINK